MDELERYGIEFNACRGEGEDWAVPVKPDSSGRYQVLKVSADGVPLGQIKRVELSNHGTLVDAILWAAASSQDSEAKCEAALKLFGFTD